MSCSSVGAGAGAHQRLVAEGVGPVMVAKGVGPVMVVVAAAEGALQQRQQGPRPVQSREGVLW